MQGDSFRNNIHRIEFVDKPKILIPNFSGGNELGICLIHFLIRGTCHIQSSVKAKMGKIAKLMAIAYVWLLRQGEYM